MEEKMNSKERIKMVLAHQEPDRVPIQDGPWTATVARWHKEGLADGITPAEYFGYEMAMFGVDTTPRFPIKTIEKTEKYIIQTTPTGATNKNFWDHTSTPGLVDRPIKKKEDWLPIKERLYPDYTRVDWVSTFNNYHLAQSEGKSHLLL